MKVDYKVRDWVNLVEYKVKKWGLKWDPGRVGYWVDFHIKRMRISVPLRGSFQSFQ